VTAVWNAFTQTLATNPLIGIFAALVLLLHLWIWRLYKRNIDDKQKQIDALAAENAEYRRLFLSDLKHLRGKRRHTSGGKSKKNRP
jgi:hypothetical protein